MHFVWLVLCTAILHLWNKNPNNEGTEALVLYFVIWGFFIVIGGVFHGGKK